MAKSKNTKTVTKTKTVTYHQKKGSTNSTGSKKCPVCGKFYKGGS